MQYRKLHFYGERAGEAPRNREREKGRRRRTLQIKDFGVKKAPEAFGSSFRLDLFQYPLLHSISALLVYKKERERERDKAVVCLTSLQRIYPGVCVWMGVCVWVLCAQVVGAWWPLLDLAMETFFYQSRAKAFLKSLWRTKRRIACSDGEEHKMSPATTSTY